MTRKLQFLSAHLECSFKNTAETFLVDAKKFAFTVRKKNIYFWKNKLPNVLCTQKAKTQDLFEEVFLKDWEIYARSTELKEKKTFSSGKIYQIAVLHTCFAVFRKVPSFLTNRRQNMLSVQNKVRSRKKNKKAVFPILNALSKTLLNFFMPKLEYLHSQTKKKPKFLEKSTKMSSE